LGERKSIPPIKKLASMPLIMKVEPTKLRITWKIHLKMVCVSFFWTQFRLGHVHKGEPQGITAARFYRLS